MRKREKRHVLSTLFAGIVIILCLVPFLVVFVGGFWQEETGVSVQAYYDVFLDLPGICSVSGEALAYVSASRLARLSFRLWRAMDLPNVRFREKVSCISS